MNTFFDEEIKSPIPLPNYYTTREKRLWPVKIEEKKSFLNFS